MLDKDMNNNEICETLSR